MVYMCCAMLNSSYPMLLREDIVPTSTGARHCDECCEHKCRLNSRERSFVSIEVTNSIAHRLLYNIVCDSF